MDFNTNNYINPQLLTLNTNVGQPDLQGGRTPGDVSNYIVSPDATASVESHPFSCDSNALPTPIEDAEAIARHSHSVSPCHGVSTRPLHPMLQQRLMESFQGLGVMQDQMNQHLGSTYTPGYPAHSPHASITVTPAGQNTGFHAIQGTRPVSFQCRDFLQQGRMSVMIECDVDACTETAILVGAINNHGLIVHDTNQVGQKTALSALQNSLSVEFPGRIPPSDEQLNIHLRNAGATHVVGHSLLSQVLYMYGLQNGRHLQLGILDQSQPNVYNATVYTISIPGARTIWLYHSSPDLETGIEGFWSAFVPPHFHPQQQITYAKAAAVIPTPVPTPTRSSRLLAPPTTSPARTRNSSPSGRGITKHTRSLRPRSSGGVISSNHRRSPSSNSIKVHNHSDSTGNKYECKNCLKSFETPSELVHHRRKYNEATKSHYCEKCGRGFLYPKDLRRHQSKHTGERQFKCGFCVKDFTRNDNLLRHLREDHPGMTPPESVVGGP